MSEYQARKARMLELQREKEEELKRELAAKAAREKQLAKEAEELRKRQEAAAKEARRIELMRANEALNKKVEAGQKKELEYDPFAEDARPAPAVVKPSAKPTTHTNAKAGPSSSKQSLPGPSSKTYTTSINTSRNHAKQKAQSHSPPPLGRKERAAKAFAQSAKKSAGDSLFSIRSLVESRDQPHSPSGGSGGIPINRTYSAGNLGSGSGSSSSYKGSSSIAIHGLGMSNGLKRDPNQSRLIPGKQPKSTREQLNSQAKIDGLRKLCPDRATRDRRTIEEIQRDIKAKKGGGIGSVSPLPPLHSSAGKGKERSPIKVSSTSSASLPKAQISSSNKPIMKPKDHSRPPKRRQSPSSSGTDSDSSSDSSPPRKKFDPYSRRSRSPPVRLNEHSSHLDIRDEIQKLFRRPGASNRPTYRDEYSDSGSDMEAGLSDVEEEERRTARIARREDELAEREEREHRLAKLKKKKEAEKKGKGK